jgi:hypothetical protein
MAGAGGEVSLGFTGLIYHFSPEEIANLHFIGADRVNVGGDLTAGRVPGNYVLGDMYWNTAWNTAGGVGDIVAMP